MGWNREAVLENGWELWSRGSIANGIRLERKEEIIDPEPGVRFVRYRETIDLPSDVLLSLAGVDVDQVFENISETMSERLQALVTSNKDGDNGG